MILLQAFFNTHSDFHMEKTDGPLIKKLIVNNWMDKMSQINQSNIYFQNHHKKLYVLHKLLQTLSVITTNNLSQRQLNFLLHGQLGKLFRVTHSAN